MLAPQSLALAMLLAAMTALGPLSTDMYLPSLPTLKEVFGATTAEVQLTLSAFLVGFAFSQLFYGPLSDRFGRKPIMLLGLVIFSAASYGCMEATSIEQLTLFRFFQAVGGCAGPVLARAVIRDIYGKEKAAKMLSYMGTAMALAPAVAPIIGGFMLVSLGWSSIFAFIAVFGVFGVVSIFFGLGESNLHKDPHALNVINIVRNYGTCLRNPTYLGYTLAVCCSYGGLFAFISGSSFVFIEFIGVEAQNFGFVFMIAVFGFMAGTLIGGRLTQKFGVDKMLRFGCLLTALSGLTMLGLALASIVSIAAIMMPMFIFMVGVGLVMPQGTAGALAPYPRMAGVASALLGFLQMSIAATVGILVGHSAGGDQMAMVTAIAIMGCGCLAAYMFLVVPNKAKAEA